MLIILSAAFCAYFSLCALKVPPLPQAWDPYSLFPTTRFSFFNPRKTK